MILRANFTYLVLMHETPNWRMSRKGIVSRTFGTPKANLRERRSMAAALLEKWNRGECALVDVAHALEDLFFVGISNYEFGQSDSLRQRANRIGRRLAIEHIGQASGLSDLQREMCARIAALLETVPMTLPYRQGVARELDQFERAGFCVRDLLVSTLNIPGSSCFYSMQLTASKPATQEPIAMGSIAHPALSVALYQDSVGAERVTCNFHYGSFTNSTHRTVVIAARWPIALRDGFTYPENAPSEVLAIFENFMTQAEANAHLL